jgi:hypothetical protein
VIHIGNKIGRNIGKSTAWRSENHHVRRDLCERKIGKKIGSAALRRC